MRRIKLEGSLHGGHNDYPVAATLEQQGDNETDDDQYDKNNQ